MFNSNEKYKLFFLRKFLNNLRIGCKKEKFPLIENFQEDNLILKLKENECEGYLKIILEKIIFQIYSKTLMNFNVVEVIIKKI